MRLKVLQLFRDINDREVFHRPGETIEVDEERGKNIIRLELGEEITESEDKAEVKDEPTTGESVSEPSPAGITEAVDTDEPVKKPRKTKK